MSTLVKNIQNTTSRHKLWTKGSKLIIGVSGGPDSVCLLDVLVHLKTKYGLELHIAHVNYRLRDDASDADEALVQSLAEKYDLGLSVLHPTVPKDQKNLEEALRDIRYAFFESLRNELGMDAIAVAHTLDDQAETLLLRLLRGSGMRGLAAMKPKTGHLIRPLLTTRRQEVLRYLSEKNLDFHEDASNTDTRFTRNRIRHGLLPYLEQNFNPHIRETLARTASLLAEDYTLLTEASSLCNIPVSTHDNGSLSFSAHAFHALSLAHQRLFLRQTIEKLLPHQKQLAFGHIEEIIKLALSNKSKSQTLTLPRLKVLRKGDKVTMTVASIKPFIP